MTLHDGNLDKESFELVKKEDPKQKPSKTGQRKEVNNIIVKCKDEDVKKELVTLITDEVNEQAKANIMMTI